MSDTPIYDEVLALMTARARRSRSAPPAATPAAPAQTRQHETRRHETAQHEPRGHESQHYDAQPYDAQPYDDDLDPYEAPTGCSWCGLPLDDIDDRRALLVQDPVAGDDILLGACCSEHADQLRHRYRVPT